MQIKLSASGCTDAESMEAKGAGSKGVGSKGVGSKGAGRMGAHTMGAGSRCAKGLGIGMQRVLRPGLGS